MLDLHNHVVFGIDDGCRTPEESVALIRAMAEAGHTGVVATPHIRPGIFDNTPDRLRDRWSEVRSWVMDAGLEGHLGAEYYFDDHLLAESKAKALLTLGERSRYVLVEFPKDGLPLRWQDVLFEVRLRGYVVVIAHPERCARLGEDIVGYFDDLRRAGVLLQLDLGSLVGAYGRAAQKLAQRLVKLDAYHLAAGDLHRPEDVTNVFVPAQRAFQKVFRRFGAPRAWNHLCVRNPRLIIDNAPPEEITTMGEAG